MEHPEFKMELDPLPAPFWSALDVVPRPACMLRVPLRRERREPKVGRVRRPAEVRYSPVTPLVGFVMGPGDLPRRSDMPTYLRPGIARRV
jgi:hypothetical protein